MRIFGKLSRIGTSESLFLPSCRQIASNSTIIPEDNRVQLENSEPTPPGRLYATHQPLNEVQRAAVAFFSAFGAAFDPKRADLVAALGETTGRSALKRMHERMLKSATGRQILSERPRITNEVLAKAADMKSGTFGHAYGQFMGRRHFQADERPPVRFIDDIEIAYVAQRARETHDLWHVLFDCPTTVCGELALKGVEFVQAGSRCADLMCVDYEHHFKEDLEELRRQWRITVAPRRTGGIRPSLAAAR